MAISFVQAAQSTTGGSVSITGVTTGNTLIFTDVFAGGAFPIHITGITDNMGNTYVQASGAYVEDTVVDEQSDIWYSNNVIGGNLTLSISYDSSVTLAQLWVGEFTPASFESGAHTSASSSNPVGPSLTPASSQDLLVTVIAAGTSAITISSPWITPISPTHGQYPTAYLFPGATGTFQAVTSPSSSQSYCSSGVIFSIPPIRISFSDTQSSSDARINEVEKPLFDTQASSDSILVNGFIALGLSDSTSASDTSPQAFSIESSSIAPVVIPAFETLTNALLPAVTKAYYKIEE